MTGCRHGAKNTLTENYLHLAERAGATVLPMTTVTGLRDLISQPSFPRPVPEIGWLGVVAVFTWVSYAIARLRSAVLVLVAAVILVTFLVDLTYAAIDPRLRGR